MPETVRKCLSCEKPLAGRSDKKFCDDYCRNAYNNRVKGHRSRYIRNINNALLRNRHILESFMTGSEDTIRVHEANLLDLGFQFRFHTHTHTNSMGQRYVFCYEYGYLAQETGWYLVIRKKEKALV